MSLCGICHLDIKKHSKKLWELHQQTQTCVFCQKLLRSKPLASSLSPCFVNRRDAAAIVRVEIKWEHRRGAKVKLNMLEAKALFSLLSSCS